jgi:hypothetical protein
MKIVSHSQCKLCEKVQHIEKLETHPDTLQLVCKQQDECKARVYDAGKKPRDPRWNNLFIIFRPKMLISSKNTTLVAALAASLMTGCATQFNDYEGSAHRAAVANVCQKRGMITSDDFAHYSALQMGWGPRQNMTIVDDNKLQSMYLQKVEQFNRWGSLSPNDLERLRLQCADISVVSSRLRGNSSANTPIIPTYTPPTTTNCMTTYGWTRCTTN